MKCYKGIGAAPGIVCAASVTAHTVSGQMAETLEEAVAGCLEELQSLYEKTRKEVGNDSAQIFEAYMTLLKDKNLQNPIRKLQENGKTLSAAIEAGMEQTAGLFEKANSTYMRQRADDIRNLKKMLLQRIGGRKTDFRLPEGEEPVVIVAESLSPADTMALDRKRLAALVTRLGGETSHVVILAKTLGIPAVTGLKGQEEITDGIMLIVDGETGMVTADPDAEALAKAREKQEHEALLLQSLAGLPKVEPVTEDGTVVHVSVNIGGSRDLEGLDLSPLYGVGLFRTEFLYTERDSAPKIKEQEEEYRKVFDLLDGKDLIVRTLDIGGDKQVPYLHLPKEENPFLGCRGIRLCFRHETLLREQLEALLRAADGRPFSVMFPMISSVEELIRGLEIWKEVRGKLVEEEGIADAVVKLGVMIETPAAMLMADVLAETVDFASIGTNDLTQYVLAADRGNPQVGVSLSLYAPAVVRAIGHTISAFEKAGTKLSVCGEAGSDPDYLRMMIGMGLQYVSVSGSMADRIRGAVLHTDKRREAVKAEQALRCRTEAEVRALLKG